MIDKKEYMKKWRAEHREQVRTTKQLNYYKHKDEINYKRRLKYNNNPEKYRRAERDYYLRNKETIRPKLVQYGKTHKSEKQKYDKIYYVLNKSRIKQRGQIYYKNNISRIKYYLKKTKLQRNMQTRKRRNYKMKNDVLFRLRINMGKALRKTLLYINSRKESGWEKELGYNKIDLKLHLEKQFTSKMSWDNYGVYWHIDHIIPISWFKTKEQQIKKGWRLSNLQPLEVKLNLEKADKYVGNPKTNIAVIYL